VEANGQDIDDLIAPRTLRLTQPSSVAKGLAEIHVQALCIAEQRRVVDGNRRPGNDRTRERLPL
jgi:hypothetical protein